MKESYVFNESGFLLLEHLVAIVILGILSISFLHLIKVVTMYDVDQNALTMHEVNTIAIRMQNEIRSANTLKAGEDYIIAYFGATDQEISFSIRNNNLVRQVDGRGGEVLGYNIRAISAHKVNDNGALVSLICNEMQKFQFYIFTLNLNLDL